MEYKDIKKLTENIIENEFQHIQENGERNFIDTDKEQIELTGESERLFKELFDNTPKEYQKLLCDYYAAVSADWVNMCRFYFKEGVKAGMSNLEFIKEIDGVMSVSIL